MSEKEKRDTTGNGDLFEDSSGCVYILLKCSFGWIALDLGGDDTFGGLKRLKSQCLDGLTPLGFTLDTKAGKKWDGE